MHCNATRENRIVTWNAKDRGARSEKSEFVPPHPPDAGAQSRMRGGGGHPKFLSHSSVNPRKAGTVDSHTVL
jgi:hypothetical protein